MSSVFFEFNFGNQLLNFDLAGITGGGIGSPATISCISGCAVFYGKFTGAAVFGPQIINKQNVPNLVNNGCNLGGCRLTIGVVDASASLGAKLNVIFQNGADGPTGSAPVRLLPTP